MKIDEIKRHGEYAAVLGPSLPSRHRDQVEQMVRVKVISKTETIKQGGMTRREVRAVRVVALEDREGWYGVEEGTKRVIESRFILGPWEVWAKVREEAQGQKRELEERNDRATRVGHWILETFLAIEPTPDEMADDRFDEISPRAGRLVIEISEEDVKRLDDIRAEQARALDLAES